MLKNKLRDKIEVIKEYTPKHYSAICNEGRLHQVFLILLQIEFRALRSMEQLLYLLKLKKIESKSPFQIQVVELRLKSKRVQRQ